MFALGPATKVYVATGATDMRKGFEGLYGLVRDELLADPLSGHLFLFSNAGARLLYPGLTPRGCFGEAPAGAGSRARADQAVTAALLRSHPRSAAGRTRGTSVSP